MKKHLTMMIMLGFLILLPQSAFACAVPVFRYALERWVPDYYEAVLIHKGKIAEDDPAASLLRDKTEEFLNLQISEIDIESSTEDEIKGLLGDKVPATLPAIALWYPWQKGRAAPFWIGEFNTSTVEALAQSPVRSQLGERLTKGQSGVWVFLESGNADKDKASLELLKQVLEEATKELKEMESFVDESEVPGVTYEFSVVSVSRSNPQEEILRTMLLNSEPDLQEYKDEPVVFPVFGRGRSLYALVAAGISADNIRETIAFLTGPCGCEIKMLNPGVDLLMAVDWDTAVMKFYEKFYEEYYQMEEPQPELTSVFPEEPADAKLKIEDSQLKTQDKVAGNEISSMGLDSDNGLINATDEQAKAVEGKERKLRGFGVVGTTAVSLGGILLAVVLGTLAVSRLKKGHP